MKFWNYAIGAGIAIIFFSSVVFSEYSKYQNVAFLEQNPFNLLGENVYSEKGYRDIKSYSGEFIRAFDGADLVFTKKDKTLKNGEVVVTGSFFNKRNSEDNILYFGKYKIKYDASNVFIKRNAEQNITKIINLGKTIKVFLPDQEKPFILPSEYQIIINELKDYSQLSAYTNYHELRNLLQLEIIDWKTKDAEILKKTIEDFFALRNSFLIYATKTPIIWKDINDKNRGIFTKPKLSSEFLNEIYEISNLIKKKDKISLSLAGDKLSNLKEQLVNNQELKTELEENKNWQLFKKSQKIWLPTINDDRPEWAYLNLWLQEEDFIDSIRIILNKIEFFVYNLNSEGIAKEIATLGKKLDQITTDENIDKFCLSALRRRLYFVIKNQLNYKTVSIEDFQVLEKFFNKELLVYQNDPNYENIKKEILFDTLEIIAPNINKEEKFSRNITKLLISFLKENYDLEKRKNDLDYENQKLIDDIILIGNSGMTPEEYAKFYDVKKSEEALLEKVEEKVDLETDENTINSSKKLWNFLQSNGINIDVKSFRTKRNALYFETRFENNAKNKNKISGTFDYNYQVFRTLSLGEATIANIYPRGVPLWIKQIGGKFIKEENNTENSVTQITVEPEININNEGTNTNIIQNTREALVNKQFLKDLLNSLDLSVSKKDITVITEDYKNFAVKNINVNFADTENNNFQINLSYDFSDQKFYDVFYEKNNDKIYLSETKINDKTLQQIIREKLEKKEE